MVEYIKIHFNQHTITNTHMIKSHRKAWPAAGYPTYQDQSYRHQKEYRPKTGHEEVQEKCQGRCRESTRKHKRKT